jgi:hypothetical protein
MGGKIAVQGSAIETECSERHIITIRECGSALI